MVVGDRWWSLVVVVVVVQKCRSLVVVVGDRWWSLVVVVVVQVVHRIRWWSGPGVVVVVCVGGRLDLRVVVVAVIVVCCSLLLSLVLPMLSMSNHAMLILMLPSNHVSMTNPNESLHRQLAMVMHHVD